MTGAIAMGTNKITGLGDPTSNQDAVTLIYVTTLYGSTASAATSAAAAAISESNAAGSASAAATSANDADYFATLAGGFATSAETAYDSFDDRYLGAKASPPTLDNDGNALITGALYFDTSSNLMKVYTGSSWVNAGSSVNGTSERNLYTATASQTTFSATYDVGFVDVYLNGVKLVAGTDFTATDGTSVVLSTGATAGDIVDIIAYGSFDIANTYTQAQSDARFLQLTGGTMSGNITFNAGQTIPLGTVSGTLAVANGGTGITSFGTGIATFLGTPSSANLASAITDETGSGALVFGTTPVVTGLREKSTAVSASDIDLSAGNYFTKTISGTTTFTVSNVASSGDVSAFILILTNGGSATVNWFSGVTWAAGTAPTLTASGVDIIGFFTINGGTTWRGLVLGLDVKAP